MMIKCMKNFRIFEIHDQKEGGQPKEGRWVKKAGESEFPLIPGFTQKGRGLESFTFDYLFSKGFCLGKLAYKIATPLPREKKQFQNHQLMSWQWE